MGQCPPHILYGRAQRWYHPFSTQGSQIAYQSTNSTVKQIRNCFQREQSPLLECFLTKPKHSLAAQGDNTALLSDHTILFPSVQSKSHQTLLCLCKWNIRCHARINNTYSDLTGL